MCYQNTGNNVLQTEIVNVSLVQAVNQAALFRSCTRMCSRRHFNIQSQKLHFCRFYKFYLTENLLKIVMNTETSLIDRLLQFALT